MKAVIYTRYGGPEVLHLGEVEKPIPKDNEILICIKAASVNSADWRIRKADPFAVRFFFGLRRPRKNILGGILSGVVEAAGKNVTAYKTGDEVFGSTGLGFGAYAAYRCLPDTAVLCKKPGGLSHEEAAVIPFGGMTALHFLGKAKIVPGQRVLIHGASGAVGTAAVQIAKYLGAHVTAVCSTANISLLQRLGADEVIDYTTTDFAANGLKYDVIYDTVGKMIFSDGMRSLNRKGYMLLNNSGMTGMFHSMFTGITNSRKVIAGVSTETKENMLMLKDLVEMGKMQAVIDRNYTLAQMAEAHAYVEAGHKKGNVSVSVKEEER